MKSLIKGRKVAELVSLTISMVIISTLVVFLILDARKVSEEKIDFDVEILDKTPHKTIALKVHNQSSRSVTSLKLSVEVDGRPDPVAIEIQYLAGKSSRTVYRMFKQEVSPQNLLVTPLEYTLD